MNDLIAPLIPHNLPSSMWLPTAAFTRLLAFDQRRCDLVRADGGLTMTNRIVEENTLTDGVQPRSYWDVDHSNQIEGFTTDISVNAGTTVDFKINVNGGAGSDYTVEIFRLGYDGGDGAREVAEWTNQNPTFQPPATVDWTLGLSTQGTGR